MFGRFNLLQGKEQVFLVPRAYIIKTQYPFRQFFESLLHLIVDIRRSIQIERLIQLEANPEFNEALLLEELIKLTVASHSQELRDHLLTKFSSLPRPKPGLCIKTSIRGQPLQFEVPPLADLPFFDTVQAGIEVLPHFCLTDYLFLLASLFQEKSIIFVSENRALLSSTIGYFTSILRPLSWTFPIIYSLPESCLAFLSSPVPLMAGLLLDSPRVLRDLLPEYSQADSLFVLLDKAHILAPPAMVSSLPLPRLNKQLKALHEPIRSYFSPVSSTSVTYQPRKARFIRKKGGSLRQIEAKKELPHRTDSPPASQIKTYLQGMQACLREAFHSSSPQSPRQTVEEIKARLGPKDDLFVDQFSSTQMASYYWQTF